MTTVGVSVAALIVMLIRKDRLHVNHGLGWMLVAAGFCALGLAPSIVDYTAAKLGIAYPPTLALTAAISVLVIKILLMDIERSHLEMRNQRLTQQLGIIETEISQLRQQIQDHSEKSLVSDNETSEQRK